MAIFTGAGVAIVTPMKENGDIYYEKLGELIEEQIAGGTDASLFAVRQENLHVCHMRNI